MKATITIKSLLENYRKFVAGELNFTNSSDKFESVYLCHHIGEMLVPPGMKKPGSDKPADFEDTDIDEVCFQFGNQWLEKVTGDPPSYFSSSSVIEEWNGGTDFESGTIRVNSWKNSREYRMNYRLSCLELAAERFPDLEFHFVDFMLGTE